MSGLVTGDNCTICIACHDNCYSCPDGPYSNTGKSCQTHAIYMDNLARINKQVRMSSSLAMMMRRAANVSKQVGQSANPRHLEQAGGPGDLIHGVQTNCRNRGFGSLGIFSNPTAWKSVTYRVPTSRARTAYRNQRGVDKKHGSYARYLARRVGGELRKEQMPTVRNRTALIHQPRNRTGTNSCGGVCGSDPHTKAQTTSKCTPPWGEEVDMLVCCSTACCDNRIPGTSQTGDLQYTCDSTHNSTRNPNSTNFSGLLGNNTQCVSSTRCGCCVGNGNYQATDAKGHPNNR